MIDDNKKNTGEEEYQLPEEEYESQSEQAGASEQAPETGGASSPSPLARFPILRNKRMMWILVVVVVVFFGFKFIGGSTNKTKANQTRAQASARTAQAKLAAQEQLASRLADLTQNAKTNEAGINALKGEMQNLRNTISQTHSSDEQLSESVQALANQVTDLTGDIKVKPKTKHVKKTKPKPVPLVYHLTAVVPGRAWIEDSKSQSMTVRVGDKVKDYGAVESINANRGMIATSSGKIIAYGVDDS